MDVQRQVCAELNDYQDLHLYLTDPENNVGSWHLPAHIPHIPRIRPPWQGREGCDSDQNSSKADRSADSKSEESPTVSRMTSAARQALQDGFDELDACIRRISAKTGLNAAQIVERWDATKTRVSNSWNIYQGFFEERRNEELARLDPKVHPNRK